MNGLSILAIDDHQLFTSGLERLIAESFPSARFVAMPGLGVALDAVDQPPSIILLDFNLNGISGAAAVALARQHWPDACILILTSGTVHQVEAQLGDHSAVQVLSKAISPQTLVERIKAAIAVDLHGNSASGPRSLSPRQLEVLRHLREGRSNKAIAERMGLSEFTVRGHVQQLFKAIGASNRTNAVFLAEQAKLI